MTSISSKASLKFNNIFLWSLIILGSLFVLTSFLHTDEPKSDQQINLRNCNDGTTIDVFLPQKATGDGAVIVCPGGGYQQLTRIEKFPIGQWLAKEGIKAFVLSYRLPAQHPYPDAMEDARLAIRYIRANADKWQINPNKIAIMGFSAGGHLASTVATHFNSEVERPDFQILIYPVITMKEPYTHHGSKMNLLGKQPPQALIEELSNEQHISLSTPPAFVYHASTDTIVSVVNSDWYVKSLIQKKIPVKYVRVSLPNKSWGGHGIGLDPSWTEPLLIWLKKYGF